MVWIIIWLVVNTVSLGALIYAVDDAYTDYKIARDTNGWRASAARSLLRSQVLRLIMVMVFLSVGVVVAVWFESESRPAWARWWFPGGLVTGTILISVNSLLDIRAKRKLINR